MTYGHAGALLVECSRPDCHRPGTISSEAADGALLILRTTDRPRTRCVMVSISNPQQDASSKEPRMDTTTTSELLTTDELAAYLKVPVPTVRMWRHNGTGPKGVRLGRHVRYRRSDVDRWIEANERAQRPRAV